MLNRIRPRSVYDVLAAIACFGVLAGGTAYASHLVVNSSDVVDESLLSQDIKNGEVKSADIANGAVLQTKLGANAVSTGKVIDNSMTGNDIAESTLVGVNADKVDGGNVCRTAGTLLMHEGDAPVTVCTEGSLAVIASCSNNDGPQAALELDTSADDAFVTSETDDPDLDAGATAVLQQVLDSNPAAPGTVFTGDTSFAAGNPDGSQLAGSATARATNFGKEPETNTCEFVVGAIG